jgi:hypothetical protein
MRSRKNPSEQNRDPTRKPFFFQKFRGISSIEYAFLFVILIAAFIGMAIYFKRATSGRWRQAVDDSFGHGRQYDPYATEETEF